MVVVMEERATEAQIQTVIAQLVEMGFDVHRSTGVNRTVIGAVGDGSGDPQLLELQEGVHEVLRISEPYKLYRMKMPPPLNSAVLPEMVLSTTRRKPSPMMMPTAPPPPTSNEPKPIAMLLVNTM